MKPAKYKIDVHVVYHWMLYLRGVNGFEIFSLVANSVKEKRPLIRRYGNDFSFERETAETPLGAQIQRSVCINFGPLLSNLLALVGGTTSLVACTKYYHNLWISYQCSHVSSVNMVLPSSQRRGEVCHWNNVSCSRIK